MNVRNLEKIQEKRLLFQRFLTSIVAPPRYHFMIASTGNILIAQSQVTPGGGAYILVQFAKTTHLSLSSEFFFPKP